jgi:multidrug efflux pump subunit AcrB
MLTSYLLSRTLIPTMASYLLPEEHQGLNADNLIGRFLSGFEARFERLREGYASASQYLSQIAELGWRPPL